MAGGGARRAGGKRGCDGRRAGGGGRGDLQAARRRRGREGATVLDGCEWWRTGRGVVGVACWRLSAVRRRKKKDDGGVTTFDAEGFLKTQRGKKIMFIGDSVSTNQFESLLCLLHAAVPNSRITQRTTSTTSYTVTFQDYELSITVFTTHYLVDIEVEEIGRVLKLDSLKNGDTWKEADILVFNTWLWWYRSGPKQPWDYVQDGDKILKDMDRMVAFRKGLTTWAKWVDSDVNTCKTKVIFQGISPFHYRGEEWDEPGVTNCSKETEPLSGSTYPAGSPKALLVLEQVLSTITKPVHLLNITTLSQLRKDGHPSSYNGFRGMDCTHWCLSGVPDTWNELLYAAISSS
ncbi:hypothetical protein Tsubulata_028981 [Turnera subulata]|uniref:Trichome birefringence-like C-terminal domain-containing protein n=1 Tax=Turnera subulata TaxID=218843 RepID=A0A9Q0F0K1_9ROSI|nr:hypothetical protein Tsubulata_028981 [Turnera subulata]